MIILAFFILPQLVLQITGAIPCPQFVASSSVSESGNISSPGYPNPYPPDSDCTYLLQGSEWQGIKITFHDFDLEPPYTAGCLSDYIDLDIYDLRDRMTFHRRFCGSSLPAPLLVLHPKAKLVFRANHAVHHRGFFATYEFVDEGDVMPPKTNGTQHCGQPVSTGSGGVLQFPGHGVDKSISVSGLDCLWLLRVNYNHRIYLRIQELEFHGSIENCQKAQLGIYDGYEHSMDESTVLKKFCGDKSHYKVEDDRALLSSRNRILVRLTTSVFENKEGVPSVDKKLGFRIIWSEVSSDSHESCSQKTRYACKETRACISKDHLGTFSTCPRLNYCISSDLVCDGVPHCSETDASDERHCFGRFLNAIIIGVTVFLLLVLIFTTCTILIKRKDWLKKMSMSICWKKGKTINAYVLDNPIHSPFIGLPRLETLNRNHVDNSSVESASICPLSDSESSDVSVCPYHGHKYMNHLPVLHEVYNLDSDDSSMMSPSEEPPPLSTATTTTMKASCTMGDLSPLPTRNQLHSWRLKTRQMKRANAVCLSDEYKTSSGEDSPCLCGGVIAGNNKPIAYSPPLSNNKVDDSGIELMESFDIQPSCPPSSHHANDKLLTVVQAMCPNSSSSSVHRSIQTDEELIHSSSPGASIVGGCADDTETECSEINLVVPFQKVVGTNTMSTSPPPIPHHHHHHHHLLPVLQGPIRRPPANKYDSLCSTVTTFGVFPESTSTDV